MDEEVLFRHAAKPGYQSREQAERAAFTSELIKALQDADARRRGSDDQQQLASAAFDKLQYDFPVRRHDQEAIGTPLCSMCQRV